MSFFIRNKGRPGSASKQKGDKKRRGPTEDASSFSGVGKAKKKKFGSAHEEISSDIESEEEVPRKKREEEETSSEDEETAQEKRLRLAKQYLAQIETEEAAQRESNEDVEGDVVGERLKKDLQEQSGLTQKLVADRYEEPTAEDIVVCRGHQLPVTCVVMTSDGKYIFSGSKDCSIIKWDAESGKKVKVIPGGRKGTEEKHKGHTAHILCMAITTDYKFLTSGDRNKFILVWNPDTCELLASLTGHRDAVSGLAFRKGSHQLFSASHDRTIKIWNVDSMSYIETLFGHQDQITGIDSLTRERAVTCGGRDGSVRVWKVIEESQLVFHGHSGSIDCIALINESTFFSGADDNSLALWSLVKKKPIVTVRNAHQGASPSPEVESPAHPAENWITSVASLQGTDLLASGSKDGCVRLWKTSNNFRTVTPLFSVPITGFVNGLQFSPDGSTLVAAVGQEHRLGRWWRLKDAKNSVVIVRLRRSARQPLGGATPTASTINTSRTGSAKVVRHKGKR